MKKTRESSSSQIGTTEKRNLIACLANMGFTHIEITMFAETNADLISHGFTPSPQSIEAETQEWYDLIHAQANVYGSSVFGGYMKVFDRPVFCAMGDNNGEIVGYTRETATPLGTAASSSTDGEATWLGRFRRYLVTNVGLSRFQTGDIMCPAPEITGTAFGGNFFTNQAGAVTYVKQCHVLFDSLVTGGIFLNNPNFSEVTTGWWDGTAYTDTGFVCYDYYGAYRGTGKVRPEDYEYDINQTWAGTSLDGYGIGSASIPQFVGEWGDLSGSISIPGVRTGDNFVAGTTKVEDWVQYWRRFLTTLTTLVDAGKVTGFNYWGGWEEQNTSILKKTGSGSSSVYTPNWRGQILSTFLRGGGIKRNPVITTGAFTEASTSFGGRAQNY